jgi:hypothetical protein
MATKKPPKSISDQIEARYAKRKMDEVHRLFSKMESLAEVEFGEDLYEHAIEIFEKLDGRDREVILHYFIEVLSIEKESRDKALAEDNEVEIEEEVVVTSKWDKNTVIVLIITSVFVLITAIISFLPWHTDASTTKSLFDLLVTLVKHLQ